MSDSGLKRLWNSLFLYHCLMVLCKDASDLYRILMCNSLCISRCKLLNKPLQQNCTSDVNNMLSKQRTSQEHLKHRSIINIVTPYWRTQSLLHAHESLQETHAAKQRTLTTPDPLPVKRCKALYKSHFSLHLHDLSASSFSVVFLLQKTSPVLTN